MSSHNYQDRIRNIINFQNQDQEENPQKIVLTHCFDLVSAANFLVINFCNDVF